MSKLLVIFITLVTFASSMQAMDSRKSENKTFLTNICPFSAEYYNRMPLTRQICGLSGMLLSACAIGSGVSQGKLSRMYVGVIGATCSFSLFSPIELQKISTILRNPFKVWHAINEKERWRYRKKFSTCWKSFYRENQRKKMIFFTLAGLSVSAAACLHFSNYFSSWSRSDKNMCKLALGFMALGSSMLHSDNMISDFKKVIFPLHYYHRSFAALLEDESLVPVNPPICIDYAGIKEKPANISLKKLRTLRDMAQNTRRKYSPLILTPFLRYFAPKVAIEHLFCKDFYMLFSMTFYRKILSPLPDEIIVLILDYCSLSPSSHLSYAQFMALSNEDKKGVHWVSYNELSNLCSPALMKCLHEFEQNG